MLHRRNSNCKYFWGRFLPVTSARCGQGQKKAGDAEQYLCPGQHSVTSRASLCHPRAGAAVFHGIHSPGSPAGSPDPCKAELNQSAITGLHLALVEKSLGQDQKQGLAQIPPWNPWPKAREAPWEPIPASKGIMPAAGRAGQGRAGKGMHGPQALPQETPWAREWGHGEWQPANDENKLLAHF